uniref:Uncharacterized protein n=1 Tax=Arundo donax TaxID=35708 RepID=A0A0A8ZKZ5_ARUDO
MSYTAIEQNYVVQCRILPSALLILGQIEHTLLKISGVKCWSNYGL